MSQCHVCFSTLDILVTNICKKLLYHYASKVGQFYQTGYTRYVHGQIMLSVCGLGEDYAKRKCICIIHVHCGTLDIFCAFVFPRGDVYCGHYL